VIVIKCYSHSLPHNLIHNSLSYHWLTLQHLTVGWWVTLSTVTEIWTQVEPIYLVTAYVLSEQTTTEFKNPLWTLGTQRSFE
jgi:hypothetical protein